MAIRIMVVGGAAAIALAAGRTVPAEGAQQTTQVHQPKYACSISVPQDGNDESLATRAKITLPQATAAAQAAVPGTVLRSGLDNENGCLVYSVEIRSAGGAIHDVKIDAGTAAVLHQETGGRGGPESEGPGERENAEDD
jgi:uncharacterized membrane protein YkoI